jgi:hypothetical protein
VAGQHISMGGAYSWLAHADAIDSTTMATDQTGAWVWDQVFGPWGQIWQQTGTRPRVAQILIFNVCVSAELNGVTMARCHIRPDTTVKTIFTF